MNLQVIKRSEKVLNQFGSNLGFRSYVMVKTFIFLKGIHFFASNTKWHQLIQNEDVGGSMKKPNKMKRKKKTLFDISGNMLAFLLRVR